MRFPMFAKARSALRRYKQNEEGTAIVLLGFAIFVLVGSAGLAFDAGRGYMLNARLSQAVDAAALAGGRSLSIGGGGDYESIIKKYFKANMPEGYMGAEVP
ncbi:MAG: pilus assembly protein TadG-related protein, partial [Kiloniellales bacterium]|nr:pilus assembly protein TadG-related protein [Kiloniellales bacterium]